jgi:serine protease Do
MRTGSAKLLLLALGGLLLLTGVGAGVLMAPQQRVAIPALDAPTRPPVVQNVASVRKASELSDAFITIAETVTPAVVRIQAERRVVHPRQGWLPRGLNDFFGGVQSDSVPLQVPEIGGGTGFIVSTDGYILTNNHVVEGANRITVSLPDRRVYDARIIGRDPTTDLAVIKIGVEGLPAVYFGDSDEARVGEWVIAIGNPGFDDASTLDFTVTSGIVSAKGRPLNIIDSGLDTADDGFRYAIEDFIQTDAVINPGNSGGPLVNLKGAVIGINTAIATSSGYNQGYGFAIPSNLARRVLKDLIEKGHVDRALLGVSIVDVSPEDAEVYGLAAIAGVLVEDFAPESPARAAGLQRGDVIVEIDGAPAQRVGQLQRLVANHAPGEVIRLTVVRYGERKVLDVELAEAPITTDALAPEPLLEAHPTLGLELADLDAELARQLGFVRAGGVVVADVAPASAADRKRVGIGHRIVSIDRRPVRTAREVRGALRNVRSGAVISLLLEYPDGRTYIANVRAP